MGLNADTLVLRKKLFLQQAGMAGHALPLAGVKHPCIGKASDMVIRLALISTLGVINACNHCGVAEEIHFHVLDIGEGGLEIAGL